MLTFFYACSHCSHIPTLNKEGLAEFTKIHRGIDLWSKLSEIAGGTVGIVGTHQDIVKNIRLKYNFIVGTSGKCGNTIFNLLVQMRQTVYNQFVTTFINGFIE